MAGIYDLQSNQPRTVLSAGVASLALHGSLIALVFGGTQVWPAPDQLSPLRFSGQTFEVDAEGSLAPKGSAAPSTSVPSKVSAALTESTLPTDDPLPADARAPDASKKIAPGISPPEVKPDPIDAASASSPSSEPGANPTNIDPFDLAIPGEPAPADARPTSAAYGAEGAPAGTIDMFAAFLRKFPEAAKNEPAWENLAPGFAGRIEFIVALEKGERGLTITIDDARPAPPYLRRSVVLTTNFLKHSHLAWRDGSAEGTQKLSLSAHVEQRKAGGSPYSHGIAAFGIHGEHRPSTAFFTYASGQHIEIELRRVP
jgi:hypothetical protein